MQNNVSISTKENDLKIKYGMINFGPERDLARTSVKYILTDVNDIRQNYIRLGFHLREFDKMGYYRDFGYSSLTEFCDVNIGLDKSAVSRCISVFEEFAMRDEHGVYKMWLNEKYSQFSYSQLCEMVSMKEEQRKLVKPEMTIKQIRELKKKNVSQKNDDVSQVATSQPTFLDKVLKYSGVVLQNFIKGISDDDCINVKHITLYDCQGKEIFKYNTCDILYEDDNNIFLRQVKEVFEDLEE